MRQLLPEPVEDVDPAALYAADARPRPPGRPWLLVNMVVSVDGATAVDGRSGPLGGPGDRAVFRAIRGLADVILVGAGTVRAEGYGPPRPGPDGTPARLAVVTRSGRLDPDARLFAEADPGNEPLVLTCEACPPEQRATLARVARVAVVGDATVDLGAALALLAEEGAAVVVGEGGPTVNGDLVAADLVDEWCLTTAPVLAGGRSPRASVGTTPAGVAPLRLDRLLEQDGACFARYVRATDPGR